jgi:predicted AAA+ superfamily ATPase
MADTGLLVAHAFADADATSDGVYRDILLGKININEGMMVENVMAQQLHARGHKLYFYTSYDKSDASMRMEIDFLITAGYSNAAMKQRVSPIEVKSTSRYSIVSLKKFKAKFSKRVGIMYVLHPKQLKVEGDYIYLPLYMGGQL